MNRLHVIAIVAAVLGIIPASGRAIVIQQISPVSDLAELDQWQRTEDTWLIQKTFHQFVFQASPVVLILQVEVEPDETIIPLSELIANDTAVTWSDYHLILANFDGSVVDADAQIVQDSVSTTAFGTILSDAQQIFLQDGSVTPGQLFDLNFAISTNGNAGAVFLLKQYATPEPTTALLVMLATLLLRRTARSDQLA